MTAFFMEKKRTFENDGIAMEWINIQASRFGMPGHVAIKKGYAQLFPNT